MKKILLIGDSIRLGYDKYVKKSLENLAEVYFHAENSKNTPYILRNLHNWTDELNLFDCDLVHWNSGHWDTLRIYGDDNLIKPDTYQDNIERIYRRIKLLFPNSIQVFATSTPVIEEGYIQDFETRLNSDVALYNKIALNVLSNHSDVLIDDLYSLLIDDHVKYHSDQTHYYTKEGTILIGDKVVSTISGALNLDKDKIVKPDISDYTLIKSPSDKDVYETYGNVYRVKR